MLICLCVASLLVVVFRVLRHKYGAYSLTVKCLLTNSDRIVLPICLKFTFSHSLFRDVWHVFVCVYVMCVCVCSCIVYFCYLRFLKTKKNNLFFYFYFESNFSLISLHTQSRSALVSCYRSLSLSFCFLFRFVVISGFAQSLDLCFTLMHFLGAHFPQEFQQFSHIIHAFSVATATRRERLRDFHCITFFLFFSFFLSLFFVVFFFNTRFAHVDVSFAVVVCLFAVFNSLIC